MKDRVVINTDQPSSSGIVDQFSKIELNCQSLQVLENIQGSVSFDWVIRTATFGINYKDVYEYKLRINKRFKVFVKYFI